MSSIFRDKIKSVVREYLSQQSSGVKSYSSGTVAALNDDGTVLAVDSGGNQVTAFPKFPMTVGQTVVLVNDGKGNFSAVPTGTKVNPVDIIHPPYFTGGAPLRSIVNEFGPQIVNPNIPAPAFPQFVFLQDAGNSAVLQFIVGGLGAQTYLGKAAISPNGRVLATVANDTAAGFVRASFASSITFPKQLDWSSWFLPKRFSEFINDATLLDKTVPLYSFTPAADLTGSLTMSITGNPVSNADILVDMAVDNAGNVYLLVQNSSVAVGTVTGALSYTIYKNGASFASLNVPGTTYFNGTLWRTAPEIVLSRNFTSGFVDILVAAGATPTTIIQEPSGLTFSRTDSLLSYWAPAAAAGIAPFFLSIDNSLNTISWQFTNYHSLTGGVLGGYVILVVIFDGVSSGWVILTADPGIISNPKFAGKIYPITGVKNVDPTHFTASLGAPLIGISPGKTHPGVFNFGWINGGSTSFVGSPATVQVDRSFT